MSIESDFFRRMEPVYENLEPFGFVRDGDVYTYSAEFQDGAFRAEVTVREPEGHTDVEPDVFVTVFSHLNVEFRTINTCFSSFQ